MSLLPLAKVTNSLGSVRSADSQTASAEPRTVDSRSTWHRDLAAAIRCPKKLLAALDLTPQDVPELSDDATTRFELLVPLSFMRRMEAGNPADPLLQQVLPVNAEMRAVDGFLVDAVGDEQARQAPGLLRKYHGRALLIAAGSCAVHCRYCFRRSYPYADEPRRLEDWEPALRQLAADPAIAEVILSGGDPLMLPDVRLGQLIERIDAIGHVDRIRIHTRLPIVLPSRIHDDLLAMLTSTRTQVIVVVHANHANELQSDCREAVRQMVSSGLPLLNQAVLLQGINDSVEKLEALSNALVNMGVMPYYLHQLDRVAGTAHFEVDVETGRSLIAELRRRLPGYAVPRFVQEVAGHSSKTPLSP